MLPIMNQDVKDWVRSHRKYLEGPQDKQFDEQIINYYNGQDVRNLLDILVELKIIDYPKYHYLLILWSTWNHYQKIFDNITLEEVEDKFGFHLPVEEWINAINTDKFFDIWYNKKVATETVYSGYVIGRQNIDNIARLMEYYKMINLSAEDFVKVK